MRRTYDPALPRPPRRFTEEAAVGVPGGQWATVNQADAGDHYVRVDPNGQLGSSRGDRTTDRGGRRSALGHALCEGEAVAGPRAGPAWHQP